jgi:CheY-like chemotaxis protein
MSQENKQECKNLIESVIDWAKKCLEVLCFQKAWQRGQVPEAEMAGRIRTTEEEQKLVEEIFSPESTFPTRRKPTSGFDIHSIQIEVYGPKKSEPIPAEKENAVLNGDRDPEKLDKPVGQPKPPVQALLPLETPPAVSPLKESDPSRSPETTPTTIPPAPVNREQTKGSPAEEISPKAATTDPSKAHLLVIDDYEPLLNMLSKSLKAAGYEPVCARDGVEGIVKLHEYAIDLIITDVQMPKLDGFDLSKMLNVRAETRDIPVIFLTEVLDQQTRTMAKNLGAADTIIKPFTMDTLLESVKTVLASHKAVEMEPASVS